MSILLNRKATEVSLQTNFVSLHLEKMGSEVQILENIKFIKHESLLKLDGLLLHNIKQHN